MFEAVAHDAIPPESEGLAVFLDAKVVEEIGDCVAERGDAATSALSM